MSQFRIFSESSIFPSPLQKHNYGKLQFYLLLFMGVKLALTLMEKQSGDITSFLYSVNVLYSRMEHSVSGDGSAPILRWGYLLRSVCCQEQLLPNTRPQKEVIQNNGIRSFFADSTEDVVSYMRQKQIQLLKHSALFQNI